MLYVFAHNVTGGKGNRKDGTADYDVQVNINEKCLWRGSVNGYLREQGAAMLLRVIADKMAAATQVETAMPILTRILMDANVHPTFKKPLVDVSQIPASRICTVTGEVVYKSKGRSIAASKRRKAKNDANKCARLGITK